MESKSQLNGATARFAVTGIKPDAIAVETEKVAVIAQANPAYPNTPSVQNAILAWIAAANGVADFAKKVAAARLALAAAILALYKAIPIWKRATLTVVAAVNEHAAGLPDVIKAWGFAVASHAPLAVTNAAPLKLRFAARKHLPPIIKWAGVPEHLGYLLQIGDGTPQGWGPSIVCPRASYVPTGLAAGQKVGLRVAVTRKSGQSDWSDVVIVATP